MRFFGCRAPVEPRVDEPLEAAVTNREHSSGTPLDPSAIPAAPTNATPSEPGSRPVISSPPADKERNSNAFDRYVLPEIPVLLRVARSLVSRTADAEDLVQDTLLRAYRGIGRFDGAHPRAWLLTIMRNAEMNLHRRRRPDLLDDADDEARPEVAGSTAADSPETLVLGAEFDAVVTAAMASLPENSRQIIELVDIAGLSYAEAAAVLDVPIGTVMSRLHRARARLRDPLAIAGLAPRPAS